MNLMYFLSVVKNSDHVQMKHQQQKKLVLVQKMQTENVHRIRSNHDSVLVNGAVNYHNGRLRLFKKENSEKIKNAQFVEIKRQDLASKILELREQDEMHNGY